MKFKNIFVKPKDLGKRNWGKEILLALVEGKYTFKKVRNECRIKGKSTISSQKRRMWILAFRKIIIKI